MNEFITNNYEKLKGICQKISKQKDVDDLFHCCLEQFITNIKVPELPDNQKVYFFTRIVINNYHSKTSPYYNQYKKHTFTEIYDEEQPDTEYFEDPFDMEWVQNVIYIWKHGDDWYWARLLELYIEEGCSITKLSIRTSIPKNSCSRDINKIRQKLKNLKDVQL